MPRFKTANRNLKMTPYRLAAALALCALHGCSWQGSMRPSVNLSVDVPHPYTVQAWGYPATSGNPDDALYNNIGIYLLSAPPFRFTFPDGYAVNSREVTTSILSEHLAPITLGDKGETVSRLTVINDRETYSIVFSIGPGERADHLSLHACKHVFRKAIAYIDGTQVFDFPIRQRDIAQLFGGPLRLGHDFVIWGYDCD